MTIRLIVRSLKDHTHAQLLTTDGRAFVADEPSAQEGDDLGPTPYDLLGWSLGACTAMTLQMYARRKDYPLEEVSVEVDHERIHADDCGQCDSDRDGRIEVFRRKIVVRGPLSDEQRDDLLDIASRCPVHKTLRSDPEIFDSIEVVK